MTDDRWSEVRERCSNLERGAELVTPLSGRRFDVDVGEDHLVVRFQDVGESRTLEREEVEALADRVERAPLPVARLSPGIEPYATLLTLLADYGVVDADGDGERIVADPGATVAGESPYLHTPATARTDPEHVHDDALLLADALERVDAEEPSRLETEPLTDLYVLSSDVSRGADRLRKRAGDALLERLGPDQTLHGRFGAVHRTTRASRRPRDERVVFDALEDHGIPREWVLGVDPEKLDVVVATTDLEEDDVYEVDERTYAQKTGVDEETKYSRLQGLAEQVDALTEPERSAIEGDLADIENRLEEALSVG